MTGSTSIHWLGCGLSSGPGIVSLAQNHAVTVWDRNTQRAEDLAQQSGAGFEIKTLNLSDTQSREGFVRVLRSGDIVVSMLPAAFHADVAKIALGQGAHMVTSSYLSDEMSELDGEARRRGLCVVNEVGLDPGIDHLFAHVLVDQARQAGILGRQLPLHFRSYCGGVPVDETPFTYKFSWTPLGVLSALRNPAQALRAGEPYTVARPWEDVSHFPLGSETFEVYPNRDSLPYINHYGLTSETNLKSFVRGTLRLKGWQTAWADIFKTIATANENQLRALSDQLWQAHRFDEGEQDRVVLCVVLDAELEAGKRFRAGLSLDERGSGWRSAMAKTVSLTVSQGVRAVLGGRLSPGVQTAPSDPAEASLWLENLKSHGLKISAL